MIDPTQDARWSELTAEEQAQVRAILARPGLVVRVLRWLLMAAVSDIILAQIEGRNTIDAKIHAHDSGESAESLRLLLIEPDDDFAYLMRKSLERAGHHVTVSDNASAALRVLGQVSFDLIILAQGLPDMRGVELLQTFNRQGINPPAIMVTGWDSYALADRAFRAGALDFIVKDPGLMCLTELPKRVIESHKRFIASQAQGRKIEMIDPTQDGRWSELTAEEQAKVRATQARDIRKSCR